MEENIDKKPVYVMPPFNVGVGFAGDDLCPSMEMMGGAVDVDSILHAYDSGFFPWYSFRQSEAPRWFFPLKRFVLFPDEVHVSHSMRNLINRGELRVTFNKYFRGVVDGCRKLRYDDERAWLSRHMMDVCCEINGMGRALSVEVWNRDDELVGGLYGMLSGMVFCGESMFSLVPSASKLAMIRLAQMMSVAEGSLIDCQMRSPHLESMGARYIEASEFISMLRTNRYGTLNPTELFNMMMSLGLDHDDYTPLHIPPGV